MVDVAALAADRHGVQYRPFLAEATQNLGNAALADCSGVPRVNLVRKLVGTVGAGLGLRVCAEAKDLLHERLGRDATAKVVVRFDGWFRQETGI
nr:hypothetical protein [Leifsonia sp. Root4]